MALSEAPNMSRASQRPAVEVDDVAEDGREYKRVLAAEAFNLWNSEVMRERSKRLNDAQFLDDVQERWVQEVLNYAPEYSFSDIRDDAAERSVMKAVGDYVSNEGEAHREEFVHRVLATGKINQSALVSMVQTVNEDFQHFVDIKLLLSKCLIEDCGCGLDYTDGRW